MGHQALELYTEVKAVGAQLWRRRAHTPTRRSEAELAASGRGLQLNSCRYGGGVPERSKGTRCKRVGSAFAGSNPAPATPRRAGICDHLAGSSRRSPGRIVPPGKPRKLAVVAEHLAAKLLGGCKDDRVR